MTPEEKSAEKVRGLRLIGRLHELILTILSEETPADEVAIAVKRLRRADRAEREVSLSDDGVDALHEAYARILVHMRDANGADPSLAGARAQHDVGALHPRALTTAPELWTRAASACVARSEPRPPGKWPAFLALGRALGAKGASSANAVRMLLEK